MMRQGLVSHQVNYLPRMLAVWLFVGCLIGQVVFQKAAMAQAASSCPGTLTGGFGDLTLTDDFVTACTGQVSVSATSTCGESPDQDPSQSYFGDLTGSIQSGTDHLDLLTCSSSDAQLSHPKQYILDGNATTWWQSAPGVLEVNVTLSLPASILLSRSTLRFRSHLAAQMRLLGSSDGGKTWRVLQYYSDFCRGRMSGYGLPFSRPDDLCGDLDARCVYTGADPQDGGNITYSPGDRVGMDRLLNEPDLRLNATVDTLRAEMVRPYARGGNADILDPKLIFYGLYSWRVEGVCQCYGSGTKCAALPGLTNTTSSAQQCLAGCQCGTTSSGDTCDHCLPAYQGVSTTINAGNATCEACSCNGYSLSCYYDNARRVSVCDNCTGNTAGDRCEACLPGFAMVMRGVVLQTNTTVLPLVRFLCEACNCNGYAETCYYDNMFRVSICDNCTNSTTGNRCEACLPGFAMVTRNDTMGTNTSTASPDAGFICEACDCNGYSDTCYYHNARRVSVCDNCTNSTTGDRCEACLPGFAMVTGISAVDANTTTVSPAAGFVCEACDCNGYSETCYYDNARRVSVCDNCTNSTTGDRCEACLPGFAMVTGIVATETNTAASPVAEVTSLICEENLVSSTARIMITTTTGLSTTSQLDSSSGDDDDGGVRVQEADEIVVDGYIPLLIAIGVLVLLFLIGVIATILFSYTVQRKRFFYNFATGETRVGRRLFSIVRHRTGTERASDSQGIMDMPTM